jgi:hypothetical protein
MIEAISGIVARMNGRMDRPMPAIATVATTNARTASGPVQPRTPKATSAVANATTSLVVGLSRR